MVILVLIQLLMIVMTASSKELKLLVSSFHFGQNNKKDKLKNIIINGDSMLNNINCYGLQSPIKYPSVTIPEPPVKIFLVQQKRR